MSTTPVIKNETSPLSSEVSSSNSIEDSTLSIHQKTQLDLILEMLVEMKSDMKEMKASQEEVNLRLTRLEEKMRREEDDPEAVQEVHEPKRLSTDLPWKEADLSDSVEDEDSPPVERHSSSTESEALRVPASFEPFVYGAPDVHAEGEQSEAVFKNNEDDPEVVPEGRDQDDSEPKQLLSDLPLKTLREQFEAAFKDDEGDNLIVPDFLREHPAKKPTVKDNPDRGLTKEEASSLPPRCLVRRELDEHRRGKGGRERSSVEARYLSTLRT